MSDFKKTPKQTEAIDLLSGGARNVMLYGGSRSGKTFIALYALLVRAMRVKSRHIILRLKFNHVKTSIWMDTLPKVLALKFPGLNVIWNNTDFFITLDNGSEIFIAGLDDKNRTEKILGKEYSTIFFNECSQIPYTSVTIALTRLAERNELTKKAYYDENPPNKKHWSYPLFILKKDPDTWEPLKNPDRYDCILMNPTDNRENIDEDYIDEILGELPEKQRERFLLGQFSDEGEGLIYYSFSRERNVCEAQRNMSLAVYIGMDFNVNPMTAVCANIQGNTIKVFKEIYLQNSNTTEMSKTIASMFGAHYVNIIPDATGKALKTSAAGRSDHQILKDHGFQVISTSNPFRMDRYNALNRVLEDGRLIIDKSCHKLIKDLEQVSYKEGTNMPDVTDKMATHISDALGYLVYKYFPIIKFNRSLNVGKIR